MQLRRASSNLHERPVVILRVPRAAVAAGDEPLGAAVHAANPWADVPLAVVDLAATLVGARQNLPAPAAVVREARAAAVPLGRPARAADDRQRLARLGRNRAISRAFGDARRERDGADRQKRQ